MTLEEKALNVFKDWYEQLPVQKARGGPAIGTISAALVVLERLKSGFNLNLKEHQAPGGAQIKGASGSSVKKILLRFGETRPFAKEGGRTNRGVPDAIMKMLDAIKSTKMEGLELDRRNQVIDKLQGFLVAKVIEFHKRQRIKLIYEPTKTTWLTIQDLLVSARETGKEGPVAQHLVGAKLQLRFPDIEVSNESYSTADDQLGRPGDFYIGDTAFHVTVAPMPAVYEKCVQNVRDGLRVFLLVPDRTLSGARQNAELMLPGRIHVESIESFVAQNIEELSTFSKRMLTSGLRKLIETYNRRVDATEIDKSMLVETPRNL